MDRVVIVGADAAGMSAAHQALRTAQAHGRELEVVVVERGAAHLLLRLRHPLLDRRGRRRAGRISSRAPPPSTPPAASTCAWDDGRRRSTSRPGPSRCVTCGRRHRPARLRPARPRHRGARRACRTGRCGPDGGWVRGVRALKTLDDGAAWIDAAERGRPRRAVVVGGGYIGIETAEAFVRRGLSTTLVTRREVMSTLDPDMGARVRAAMNSGGVEVVCSEEVDGLDVRRGRRGGGRPLRRRRLPRRRRRPRPRRHPGHRAGQGRRPAARGVRRPAARRPPAGRRRRLGGR